MAKRIARPGKIEKGLTAAERLFTRLEERIDGIDKRLDKMPTDPHGIEARVRGVETAVKMLAESVLHDMVRWTCENCGHKNEVLRLVARHVPWICGGCGCVPLDDFRQFHIHRRT